MCLKTKTQFRDYINANEKIINVYELNHQNQTYSFVQDKIKNYCTNFDRCRMTIWAAIKRLSNIIDESDPDFESQSQIIHSIQTAEKLRSLYPDQDWLHLVGLIHDLGKVLLLPEFGLDQWEVVGDTYPVGCALSDKIIYYDLFANNPDSQNPLYNSELGIYEKNCGLDNVTFSFGHDEYMYRFLVHNKCLMPELGLKIIRYHSFYAWHHQTNEYENLESDADRNIELKKWCQVFSDCDLYTKNDKTIEIKSHKSYYQNLIKKYFIEEILEW